MGVQFDETFVFENGRPQTVEDSIKVYTNWAGIHQFKFDNLIEEVAVTVVSTDPDEWKDYTILETPVPHDVLVEFTLGDDNGSMYHGWGCVIGYEPANHTGYIVGIDWDGIIYLRRWNSLLNTYAELGRYENWDFDDYGHIKVAMRQMRFSDNEADLWHIFSLWNNNKLLMSWAVKVSEPIKTTTQIGFIIQGLGTDVTFTNVRVPQLTEFTEWASIDPGEPPIGGLQRSIEGRYVKFFMRANGEFRAWRSKPSTSVITYTDDDTYVLERVIDRRVLYSHVRMLGAYAEAEYIRGDLLRYGHRFKETNNPYIMSEDECYEEAKNEIRRMEEMLIQESLETPYSPILEPEDRITTPFGDRIISHRGWSLGTGVIGQSLSVRNYAFEE